jgi:hypothetical protein
MSILLQALQEAMPKHEVLWYGLNCVHMKVELRTASIQVQSICSQEGRPRADLQGTHQHSHAALVGRWVSRYSGAGGPTVTATGCFDHVQLSVIRQWCMNAALCITDAHMTAECARLM